MYEGLFDRVVVVHDHLFRNIATIRVSEDLLDDLSDDPKERAYGEAAARICGGDDELKSLVIMRPFQYAVAIDPARAGNLATRFSDGTRYGVWYGSLELLTTVYETVHNWKRLIRSMQAAIDQEVIAERRVFRVKCDGILVDLREKHRNFPGLLDPASYDFTHKVGAYLHDQGQNGLLVKSARCEGINAAVFKHSILSNARHHSYLTYKWRPGQDRVKIDRSPGRTWKILKA